MHMNISIIFKQSVICEIWFKRISWCLFFHYFTSGQFYWYNGSWLWKVPGCPVLGQHMSPGTKRKIAKHRWAQSDLEVISMGVTQSECKVPTLPWPFISTMLQMMKAWTLLQEWTSCAELREREVCCNGWRWTTWHTDTHIHTHKNTHMHSQRQ